MQRDIGRLAKYTIEMGGSIELLDLALRIPPWEPMHALTADETRLTHLATDASSPVAAAPTVASAPVVKRPIPRVTDGVRATAISERRWAVVDHAGVAALARRQPLTFEGEDIGSFDLMLACGAGPDSYDVTYVERRHDGGRVQVPAALGTVTVTVGRLSAPLKVVSSERRTDPDELVTFASGPMPASLIDGFAAVGSHSMMIETASTGMITGIRLGNTGAQQNLPRLAAGCAKAHRQSCRIGRAQDWRDRGEVELLRRLLLRFLGLDLIERRHHGIEGEHGRGMARLIVAHRLEHGDVGPFAGGRRAVLLQHLAHGLAQLAQFGRLCADDVAGHDRGRSLAERAGLHVMGEIADHRAVHLEVDGDGRSAQLGMGGGAGVGLIESSQARDIARQIEDSLVINLVDH